MSNLIALQNAYGANARVMTTIQQMMSTLLQIGGRNEHHRTRIDHCGQLTGAEQYDESAQHAQRGVGHRAGGADLFGPRSQAGLALR
jgi:hypothetical protein